MHPNCNCRTGILDTDGKLLLTVGKDGFKSGIEKENSVHWYTPLLRIPEDARKMANDVMNAQYERSINITDPISFLDWLTYGMISATQNRYQVMLDDPSPYNITNWLTMGGADMVKGAFAPEEPLSLSHWLDSFGTVMAGYTAYNAAKGLRTNGRNKTGYWDEPIENTELKNVSVNKGQQDKHIIGTNNYKQSIEKGIKRSILKENPQQLLDDFAGTGQKIGTNKERIDFGKIIGEYYDTKTGNYIDTTRGIIHYDSNGGAHIVPSAPIGY